MTAALTALASLRLQTSLTSVCSWQHAPKHEDDMGISVEQIAACILACMLLQLGTPAGAAEVAAMGAPGVSAQSRDMQGRQLRCGQQQVNSSKAKCHRHPACAWGAIVRVLPGTAGHTGAY